MPDDAKGVDLEERARAFFTAMDDVKVPQIMEFFGTNAVYDVQGFIGPLDRQGLEAYLNRVKKRLVQVRFTLDDIQVRRNVTFVEWHNVGVLFGGGVYRNHGVHVLSWDQDGLIAHAAVYTETEAVRALVGDDLVP